MTTASLVVNPTETAGIDAMGTATMSCADRACCPGQPPDCRTGTTWMAAKAADEYSGSWTETTGNNGARVRGDGQRDGVGGDRHDGDGHHVPHREYG